MTVRVKSNRKAVEEQLDRAIAKRTGELADQTLSLVQTSYREAKHGTVYRVGKTPTKGDKKAGRRFRGHRASAPGEAPAIDTGALSKGTTRTTARKVDRLRWVVSLGITAQSGRGNVVTWLEKGTHRILPRPAWGPAIAVMRARLSNLKG